MTRFIIKKVLQKYDISLHDDSIISDIKKETYIDTSLKKYGVKNYAMLKECHKKMEETNLERYGTKTFAESQKWKDNLLQWSQWSQES